MLRLSVYNKTNINIIMTQIIQKPFSSIDTFVKEHVRSILEECDYQGKDEQGNNVYEHITDYPVITYAATHKIGGTNTSIGRNNGMYFYQSRNNILADNTKTPDQNGFRSTYEKVNLSNLFNLVDSKYGTTVDDEVIIYGEWCGSGIKDNHSISHCSTKQWIVFAIKINDEYVPNFEELCDEENRIFNILEWGTFDLDIDYNQFTFGCWKESNSNLPEDLQQIADKWTLECPVSKYFGITGKGEGLVLVSKNYISPRTNTSVMVKIKNQEYDISPIKIEKVKTENPTMDLLITEILPTSRLEQFCNFLINKNNNLSMKDTVAFQNLVLEDIVKECSNIITDRNISEKEYIPVVRKLCSQYLKEKINTL